METDYVTLNPTLGSLQFMFYANSLTDGEWREVHDACVAWEKRRGIYGKLRGRAAQLVATSNIKHQTSKIA